MLDDNGLSNIVTNRALEPVRSPNRLWNQPILRKTEISSFLFRALPLSPNTEMPITDSVQIYVGMAAVLSTLGLERKKGFVLKELLGTSITGLVQARKIGAAEMGIHPAAGLSALNNEAFDLNPLDVGSGDTEDSMRGILSLVASIYGASSPTRYNRPLNPNGARVEAEYDSLCAIIERAENNNILASYGDISLKVDIFKTCIDFCEALPDFQGVLQFTVALLRTIRGSIMLSPDMNNVAPILAPEEQVRFYNNVKRTVGAASRLGYPNLEAEYWDDFLVRGVGILGAADIKQPVQRSRREFGMSTVNEERGSKGPFIYSAFSKAAVGRVESLVIAGEPNTVKVVLQNPYELDLEIESLRLEGEGVSFEAETNGLWLRPFSMQSKVVPLLVSDEGTLKITGCTAKVKYCKRRWFPIFTKTWKPVFRPKLKRTGLAARDSAIERPLSWGSSQSESERASVQSGPEPDSLIVNVIKRQPVLEIKSTSLFQNAVMILEGQTRTFTVTLRNLTSCPVDIIFFTFHDSTTRRLQTAISNKDKLPAEVHELEYQLSEIPALRWKRSADDNEKSAIAPHASSTFTIEIFGKPGLDYAEVQIDYGYTGISSSEIPETFYTRQLSLPLTVTVNSSVEVVRCDILPFNPDFAWLNRERSGGTIQSDAREILKDKQQFPIMLSHVGKEPYGAQHCLLLLDLRNSWPNPLSTTLSVTEYPEERADNANRKLAVHEVTDILQPGQITRMVIVVPSVYLDDSLKAIPSLGHANKRQFVVSARKITYESELAGREAFWFREELLKRLRGTWKDEIAGYQGAISLREITLTNGMIDALRIDDLEITFLMKTLDQGESDSSLNDSNSKSLIKQTGYSKFTIPTNTFLTLCVTIFNRSSQPVHPLVRLFPSLRHQPPAIALELSKRLCWTGMLQRALPILGPGESTEAQLGITALCPGEYEIGAYVEEVRRLKPRFASTPLADATAGNGKARSVTGEDADEAKQHRPREDDIMLEESIAAAQKQRRVWHARMPCLLSARDITVQDS